MKTFLEIIKDFNQLREFGYYRLCWIESIKQYAIYEFFDEEIPLIDSKKIELLVL